MKLTTTPEGIKFTGNPIQGKLLVDPIWKQSQHSRVTGSDWYTQSKTFGSNQFTVNSVSRHLEEANKSALFGEISTT